MEQNERQFNHLKQANDLVYNVWDGAALFCLQAGPLRWTDVARHIDAWSGQRPSESQVTRALKRLARRGYVTKSGGPNHKHGKYTITDTGRTRVARISVLINAIEVIEGRSDR